MDAVVFQQAEALNCSHLVAMQNLEGFVCGKSFDYRHTRPLLRQLYFRSDTAYIVLLLCVLISCPSLDTDLKLRHTLPSGELSIQTPLSCCCTTG